MQRRPLTRILIALLALGLFAGFAACGDDDETSSSTSGATDDSTATTQSARPEIKIAHQAFGESEIAAQIYGQLLADAGFDVSYQAFNDRAAIYAAIESGDANFSPEYAASGLEFLNGNAGEASSDIVATAEALNVQLADKDMLALEPSGAVDTNSLVVTQETSDDKGITAISDLTEDLKLGAPQDCPTNAGCLPALKETYGIDLEPNFVPLDLSGPLTKEALSNGDIDVAVIFSTDSSIAVNGWVVLEDDKGIFNADNIIPVMTSALGVNADLVELVNSASAALTTENVTEMNRRFDVDKEDAADIAESFLNDEGLLG